MMCRHSLLSQFLCCDFSMINFCSKRRCTNKEGPPFTNKAEDKGAALKKLKKPSLPPLFPSGKRRGRPPKRLLVEVALSVDDETASVQDNDALMDGDAYEDDLVGEELTNRPLTELLRVSADHSLTSSLCPQVCTALSKASARHFLPSSRSRYSS